MSCNAYANGSGVPIILAGTLPPDFCPATWQEVFTTFLASMIGALPGSYAGLVTGSDTPAASDQDKLWFKSNSTCLPLGLFAYYDGSWKRAIPHHMPAGSIIDYWSDDFHATDHVANARRITYIDVYEEDYDSLSDATDPFWVVCDGTNGTPDLRGRFRLGAGDNPDPLITNRLVGVSVGSETVTLTADQLPTLNVPLGTAGSVGVLAAQRAVNPNLSVAINAGGNSHPNIPPAVCIYPIMRTARTI